MPRRRPGRWGISSGWHDPARFAEADSWTCRGTHERVPDPGVHQGERLSSVGVSERGLAALKAERDEVLGVARTLTPDEWARPSDCAGWRVQDVVNHMANVYRNFVDPASLPPRVPGKTEATQDAAVDACKAWTSERVLADYEEMSEKGIAALTDIVRGPTADRVIPLDDLGSHPLHRLADALAFDHFCHLRNDILRPNGPIERPSPPVDDLRVGAAVEWLIPGIPQMSPPALTKELDRPVALRLTGHGGGEWTMRPGSNQVDIREGTSDDVAASVTSPATEFIIWATRRRPWRERDVSVEGDRDLAVRVLDAIHVF